MEKSAGESSELATTERELPAIPPSGAAGAGVEGEVGLDDVRLPRLNVVQKVGDLSENPEFNFGDIVFDKDVVLAHMGDPLVITVLHMKNQFKEFVPYGSDIIPNIFDTRQEVLEAGGNFDFGSDGYYERIAHATLLLAAPEAEEENPLFSMSFDGKPYALALYTMQRTAYTSMAKEINTAAVNWAKDGIWKIKWSMFTEKRKNGANTFCVPRIKRAGRHEAGGSLEFIESLLNG